MSVHLQPGTYSTQSTSGVGVRQGVVLSGCRRRVIGNAALMSLPLSGETSLWLLTGYTAPLNGEEAFNQSTPSGFEPRSGESESLPCRDDQGQRRAHLPCQAPGTGPSRLPGPGLTAASGICFKRSLEKEEKGLWSKLWERRQNPPRLSCPPRLGMWTGPR